MKFPKIQTCIKTQKNCSINNFFLTKRAWMQGPLYTTRSEGVWLICWLGSREIGTRYLVNQSHLILWFFWELWLSTLRTAPIINNGLFQCWVGTWFGGLELRTLGSGYWKPNQKLGWVGTWFGGLVLVIENQIRTESDFWNWNQVLSFCKELKPNWNWDLDLL